MKKNDTNANYNYGFPTPGPQQPTGQDVMNHVFFTTKSDWKNIRETEQFDFIVIGSSFCCLAFVERTLTKNPFAKILILERGEFFLPEHFQNLPLPYKKTLGGLSETYPWPYPKKPQKEHISNGSMECCHFLVGVLHCGVLGVPDPLKKK
ncbi:hypothetical protein [Cellulophaga sp. Ld12]|uniref:hypothetical protein n=1 Tax=Cellulophaga sp. Ld12 TaxID=3229535 RepID=UPI0038698F71